MGLNFVLVCEKHKMYNYSMRGEEFVDTQVIMRLHGKCMKEGMVRAECDTHSLAPQSDSGYTEMWPYETRPYVVSIEAAVRMHERANT